MKDARPTTALSGQIAQLDRLNGSLIERMRHEALATPVPWGAEYGEFQSGGWWTTSLIRPLSICHLLVRAAMTTRNTGDGARHIAPCFAALDDCFSTLGDGHGAQHALLAEERPAPSEAEGAVR